MMVQMFNPLCESKFMLRKNQVRKMLLALLWREEERTRQMCQKLLLRRQKL